MVILAITDILNVVVVNTIELKAESIFCSCQKQIAGYLAQKNLFNGEGLQVNLTIPTMTLKC